VEKCGSFAKVGIEMKKLLGVAIVFVATVLLAACGGERELDFRSVLDVETDTVLRLGDSLSDFEDALGLGVEFESARYGDREDIVVYDFANRVLEVIFVDEEAVSISQRAESTRFQFSDMSFDMTPSDMSEWVIPQELEAPDDITFYGRFYDSRGRDITGFEDVEYIATIMYRSGDGIDRLIIITAEFFFGYED